MTALLKLEDVNAYIGPLHILQGVSFEVPEGDITVILGRNGAGKTTTLRCIMGLNPVAQGKVLLKGEQIQGLPTHEIARRGIGYVPEAGGIFEGLSVEENISVAEPGKKDGETRERIAWILDLFPDLKVFWKKRSGHLSGGQKQMLSIAKALVTKNDLLLIDEPSKGLAPVLVEKMMDALNEIKGQTTIVLVEQNFIVASRMGRGYYILEDGRSIYSGQMQQLKDDEVIKKRYLGIG